MSSPIVAPLPHPITRDAVRPLSARLRRPLRAALFLAFSLAVGWVIATQAHLLRASVGTLATADPWLVLLAGGLVAARYAASAVSVQASTPHLLRFRPTLAVQLASSFVGRVTPEGVGWLVLNIRYLDRSGLEAGAAWAAVTVKMAAGALTRIGFALVVAVSVAGTTTLPAPSDPEDGLVPWLLLPAVGVGLGIAILLARRSRRVRAVVTPAVRDLVALRHQPRRGLMLLASTLLLSVFPALTLATSVAAVGASAALPLVLAVYLAGTAIAAASPTPGNLGALELAFTAGLGTAGVVADDALAAVLLYRLLSFWAPIVPGLVAFRIAQRDELI